MMLRGVVQFLLLHFQIVGTTIGYLFLVHQFASDQRTCAQFNSTAIVDLCNVSQVNPGNTA